ncbi:MAG: BON domain-containing protein [Burkholderiales bacterium]|jgi:osmotically-inducible protein OsmY|nr:BON domain-containing protein [Burkholderiales bacterium]
MVENEQVVKDVHAALEHGAHLDPHAWPVRVEVHGATVTLEGEVGDIVAKRRAVEQVAKVPGVNGVVDRLRLRPVERRSDGEVGAALADLLTGDAELVNVSVRMLEYGKAHVLHDAGPDGAGAIDYEVRDGVVTLTGRVISLSHKRIAGVMAWWVPGSVEVVNGIEVVPAEQDNDDEIVDALRLVLETDPFVPAGQIRVASRNGVVTLDGYVPNAQDRDLAEHDAWYTLGVRGVVNNIKIGV